MSISKSDLTSAFNRKAVDELPMTDFCAYLSRIFGRETAVKVMDAFQKMDLPAPQDVCEFLDGTEGALIFLNKYGVVIRIEYKDTKNSRSGCSSDRINDSPWILKPLASLDVGKAIIEVCPGCEPETELKNVERIIGLLHQEKIDYWDSSTNNSGRIPIKTPQFPEGISVIIDRLAVRRWTASIRPIKRALDKMAQEAVEAQEKLYAPLRKVFDEAWGTQKMAQFWTLCESYVQEGKLIAGWNKCKVNGKEYNKATMVVQVARNYAAGLESADQTVNSTASAAPQSPLQLI